MSEQSKNVEVLAEPQTQTLKEKTAKGLFWGGLSNGLMQVFNFAFGIILANLLLPAEYGLVALLGIFSSLASILQEGGFISALNQKENPTQADYNAVFWFSSLMGLGLYVLGFLCAPLIADYFNEERLTDLARYSFIAFFIAGLNIAPKALLFRQIRVRESSAISICSLLLSGTVGVAMAFAGFSYWGLATQGVVYVLVNTALTFWRARWRPSLHFDFSPLRGLMSYSGKLMLTNMLTVVNANFFNFILGRLYSPTAVGNFSQANKWTTMGYSTLSGMVAGIAQPLFVKVDDNTDRQVAVFRKLLRFTALLSFPAMLGFSLVAPELIVIAIGTKWAESAHILQVLCLWGAIVPISIIFSNYLLARGRSDIYMWSTLALVVAQLIAVLASSLWGMEVMFRSFVVVNILWLLVWHWFVRRELPLRFRFVLRDLAPYALLSIMLCLAAHFLFMGVPNIYLRFVYKVAFVGTLYLGTLYFSGSVILREGIAFLLKKTPPPATPSEEAPQS